MQRRITREIKIGNLTIGGKNLIRVQSMTNTKTIDIKATVEQISGLEKAGCEIVRVTVPDMQTAKSVSTCWDLVLYC